MEVPMSVLSQIKSIASRSQATLVQDAIGASSLFVMLLVCLHLPSFF
jgi:hypothetical protein